MSDLVRMTALTHPFKSERREVTAPEGMSLGQMLDMVDARDLENAIVFIKGEVIPRESWETFRPRNGMLVEVRAFPVPMGGGGDGGKNPVRTILTIAVIAFAMWAGPAGAAMLGFAAGTKAFAIASGVVSAIATVGGMLAINAIAPIRMPKLENLSGNSSQDSPTLYIGGARNALRPFSPVPVVLGKYRMTPPLGGKPYTEVIGEKQFIRMLFVWGIGPVDIDTASLKIGETPLSSFVGVEVEHREGYATDDPLTLYPSSVVQEDFTVLLTQAGGWVERTSGLNADELGVDIAFPNGLVEFDDQGRRSARQVNIEIEYREVGVSPDDWHKIDTTGSKFKTTIPTGWLNLSGDDLASITFDHNRTSSIRHGIRWGVASRGQYEVRVRRVTADTDSTQIFDQSALTALRTITDDDPINSYVPIAKTALVIQATDQLNNIIDEFNGIVTSVCEDWDDAVSPPAWTKRETQNPASLFRHVLQTMTDPVPDARIDLDALEDWHEFCEDKGFKFNMVRDFRSSVWETLADIAAAGRAAPAMVDGKWSVVVEQERAYPVSQITPRNSFDFKAEKYFLNYPHGWRIQFPNEDEGYRFDERRVYRDGYNDGNATIFEEIELPGVTDPDLIFKLGRFRLAQGIHQPERWMVKQDMEYLTYRRGDMVAVTHDVLLVGLAAGRVKSVVLSDADVTGVTVDEAVTMEGGKDYGISIRTLTGQVTRQVQTVVGTTNVLILSTPILGVGSPAEAVVAKGDLFGFGILGQETDQASVIAIEPETSFRAQITMVPYREDIFNADSEIVPVFETRITALVAVPAPNIRDVVSDERALALGPGDTLRVRISVNFDPLSKELFGVEPGLRVQVRPSGTSEPWINAVIEGEEPGHVFITGVRTRETWDVRLRFNVPGRLPGPWAYISNHLVVGKSTPPGALKNMTISVFGSQALIRWDKPVELDVLFGGEVVFRHTAEFDSPVWGASVSIGQAARARTLYAVLPLKAGTYMARVYDVAGNMSTEITTVSTKQASVHAFANVDTIDEAPDFLGDHDGTVEDTGMLKIDSSVSPRVLEGTYKFASGMDLTTVQRVRLTTRIELSVFIDGDTIDARLSDIDDWEDFDGAVELAGDARIFVRYTDDDPAGSPVEWSDWERLESAEFEARAFEFKVHITLLGEEYNLLIDELGVDAEGVA